jgi:xanthine dehydrogenase accessory factor
VAAKSVFMLSGWAEMEPINLKKLNTARRDRVAAILLTEIAAGRDRVVREDDAVAGELGSQIEQAFRSGKSGLVMIEGIEFFLNVHLPPPRIVVIGAVHISQALAPIARVAGYDLEIIDPRTAFATPERFAAVTLHAEWPQDVLGKQPLDAYTALVAVTHDPKIDDFPILAAIAAKCFYIGALGSRKTHAKRVERLMAGGASEADLARIHAPIGLPIGASSPAEIAVATMAQIIHAFRNRSVEA